MLDERAGEAGPDVRGGFHGQPVFLKAYGGDGLHLADDLAEGFVGLRRLRLGHIVPLLLQLPAQHLDGAAGDEASLDENADPVADLLYLVKLVGGEHDGDVYKRQGLVFETFIDPENQDEFMRDAPELYAALEKLIYPSGRPSRLPEETDIFAEDGERCV